MVITPVYTSRVASMVITPGCFKQTNWPYLTSRLYMINHGHILVHKNYNLALYNKCTVWVHQMVFLSHKLTIRFKILIEAAAA